MSALDELNQLLKRFVFNPSHPKGGPTIQGDQYHYLVRSAIQLNDNLGLPSLEQFEQDLHGAVTTGLLPEDIAEKLMNAVSNVRLEHELTETEE